MTSASELTSSASTCGIGRADIARGAWVNDTDLVEIVAEQAAENTHFYDIQSRMRVGVRGWIKASYVVPTGPDDV